jgi:dTMP kinase
MTTRGVFVTFEGIEGVGKSTQLLRLRARLERLGREVVTTREPGGTPLAEAIRGLVLNAAGEAVPSSAELLLMFAARAVHVENLVRPALARGAWVLCDRFYDATYAYQGGGRGVALSTIDQLASLTLAGLRPNLTFLLDAPVTTALARARSRGGHIDRFESEHELFFERVQAMYHQRLQQEPGRIQLLDATLAPDVVESLVWERIEGLINAEKGAARS